MAREKQPVDEDVDDDIHYAIGEPPEDIVQRPAVTIQKEHVLVAMPVGKSEWKRFSLFEATSLAFQLLRAVKALYVKKHPPQKPRRTPKQRLENDLRTARATLSAIAQMKRKSEYTEDDTEELKMSESAYLEMCHDEAVVTARQAMETLERKCD